MKILFNFKILSAALVLLFASVANGAEKPWHFEAGVGVRNLTPMVLVGGVSYDKWTVRVQGLGFHNDDRDFWCGFRSSFLMTFFRNSPFHISLGIGAGYEYAQAPNNMHQALNQANNAPYLYPYNNREMFDVSGEIWTYLRGLYTQISIPVYYFMEHNAPRLSWGMGYMYNF